MGDQPIISDVSEFVDWVESLSFEDYSSCVYRGLHDEAFDLSSAVYREIDDDDHDNPNIHAIYSQKLDALLEGARERLYDEIGRTRRLSDLELMANLQHDHARTMLIDFS